ncbi:unnamed protein product, partial [Rotaria sordida]
IYHNKNVANFIDSMTNLEESEREDWRFHGNEEQITAITKISQTNMSTYYRKKKR